MMIVSIGLALAVRYVIQFYFGGATQQLPYAQSPEIQLGPVSISPNNLWSLVISAVVIGLIGIILLKTRLGKATRAVADNPALAAASGIDVDSVIRIVWITGGMLASLGNRLLLRSSMPTEAQIRLWDRVMVPLSQSLDPLFRRTLGKTVVAIWKAP